MLQLYPLLAQATDATLEAAETDTGPALWLILLIVAAFLIVPFVLGEVIARLLKMKDTALRFGVIFFALSVCLSPFVGLWLQDDAEVSDAFQLGIDLKGGMNMVFEVDREKAAAEQQNVEAAVVDRMVGAIQRRIDPAGTQEISVRRRGEDKIEITVPDVDQIGAQLIADKVTRLGSLEFAVLATERREKYRKLIERARALDDSQDDLFGPDPNDSGKQILVAGWRSVARGDDGEEKPFSGGPGTASRVVERLVELEDGSEELRPTTQYVVVFGPEEKRVTGKFLTRADKAQDPSNSSPAVGFNFNEKGAYRFGNLTSSHLPSKDKNSTFRYHLAILLDGKLESAPTVNSTIKGSGIITGDFTQEEVEELRDVLNAGALDIPLKNEPRTRRVDPSLGAEVIEQGTTAIAIAGIAVIIFMFVFYRFAGVVANFCLLLNIVLVLGAMAFVGGTFTLPGLAGIVLTIGMAVDANVLIFERIREEKARGSSPKMAVQNGFDRAFTTIVDANLTTLITAVVLYVIGTVQIRGFAVTLFIGIVMSMFTALYVGRLIFEVLERKRMLPELKMMSLVKPNTTLDFIGKRGIAAICSVLLLIAGIAGLYTRGLDNLDIDLRGGSMVSFEFDKPKNLDTVQDALEGQFTDATYRVSRLETFLGDEDTTGPSDAVRRFRLQSTISDPAIVSERVNAAFADNNELNLVKIQMTEPEIEEIAATSEESKKYRATIGFTINEGEEPTAKEVPTSIVSSWLTDELAESLAEDREGAFDAEQVIASLLDIEGTSGSGLTAKRGTTKLFDEFAITVPAGEVDRDDLEAALGGIQSRLSGEPYFSEVDTFSSSVANEMRQQAFLALLVSLLAIIGYVWFRFQRITFGLAAVAALIHDILIVVGMVALGALIGDTPVGPLLGLEDFKINLPMIAAFLTIVGYSLNDTIVVFDRIREVRGKNPALTEEMINRSLNQTLSRTLLTSVTTLLVVLILYIAGGQGIHGFAYCLVIGVFVGTYSSIYVASPVLLWLMNRPGVAPVRGGAPARNTPSRAGSR